MKKNAENFEDEHKILFSIRTQLDLILRNRVRAAILFMLFRSPQTNYSMQVERMAERMGVRHSLVLYHLDKLHGWKLVVPIKHAASSSKRNVWQLNLNYPTILQVVHSYLTEMYTPAELTELSNKNKSFRK